MIYHGNCIKALAHFNRLNPRPTWDVIFADPPDGINLQYNEYNDRVTPAQYRDLVDEWVYSFIYSGATCIWLSFNSRWTLDFAKAVSNWIHSDWEFKPCVQTFTFGQHNHRDLGNNHRPLWRLRKKGHPLFPDRVRVPSWRQLNGDKRADPRGRVPGDVLDFPRVTGNSKQRRAYHPTQLHEGLVERCLLLTCREGARVLDPFGGTGTTLRVCKKLGIDCDLMEIDRYYCERIREEHPEQESMTV